MQTEHVLLIILTVATITISSLYNRKSQSLGIKSNASRVDTVPPVVWAMEMPRYNGGDKKLNKYLYKHLGLRGKGKGVVIAKVFLDAEGNVTDASILRTFDESLNEEIINAIKNMPKWHPARMNGRPVAYDEMTIPIRYE